MDIFVEKSFYHIQKNCIRVYNSNELHYGKCSFAQPMEWYQISLDGSFLKDHPALSDKIVNRPRGCENVFISKKHESILALIEEIFEKQNGSLGEHYLLANVIKILCILNESENNIEVKMGKNEGLQGILEDLNKNLTNIKTVEDITRLTHFSASYIHKLFKKHLNITPHQYILMKKLSNAKELLSKGATVSDACFNSGFDDYANFITVFRKHFGITPKKHQRSHP